MTFSHSFCRYRISCKATSEETSERTSDKTRVETSEKASEKTSENGLVGRLVDGLVQSRREIKALVQSDPRISKIDMAGRFGISTTAVDKNTTALKKKGLLKRVGLDKGGHWEVVGE